jgi:hypothetical protein
MVVCCQTADLMRESHCCHNLALIFRSFDYWEKSNNIKTNLKVQFYDKAKNPSNRKFKHFKEF